MAAAAAALALGAARARADEPASSDVAEPTFTYVVRAGDTCNKIGKRVYGDGERYDLIHKYNALGPLPHRLVKGQQLRLPVLQPTPDAKLTGAAGPVRARPPETEAWREAARGLPLFRLWRVNSQDRASAEITFRDESRVYLRENTVVIIYGDTGAKARRDTQDAVLERGTLKTRLGELAGEGGFQLETPSAAAGVGRGAVVFEVDDTGATRVSNLEGDAVSVAGKLGALASAGAAAGAGGAGAGAGAGAAPARPPKLKKTKPVAVASGMGVAVEPGKAPSAPRALPAAPAWTDAADVAAVLLGGTPVTLSWQPVAVAARYRVELSRDPAGADIETRVEVPADVTSFEAQGLPEGSHWVRVSTVDADRFESPPSPARRLTLGLARALPPRGLAGDAALAAANVVGGTVLAPAGFRCGPADGSVPAASAVLLRSPGELALRCETAAGVAAGGFAIDVAPLTVTLPAPALVRAGASTTVRVAVPAGLGNDVDLASAGAADSGARGRVTSRGADGQLELELTGVAPGEHSLALVLRAGGEALPLGSIAITVSPAEVIVRRAGPRRPVPLGLDVGAFASTGFRSDDFRFGRTEVRAALGFGGGLRGAKQLGRGLALELEVEAHAGAAVRGSTDLRSGNVLIVGTRAFLRWQARGKLAAFARAGGGADFLTLRPDNFRGDSTAVTANAGAGLLWHLGARRGLRFELLSAWAGSTALSATAQAGAFLTF